MAKNSDPTIAVLYGWLQPNAIAQFNAAAQKMKIVVVDLYGRTQFDGAGSHPVRFSRVVPPAATSNKDPNASPAQRVAAALEQVRPDVVVLYGWYGKKEIAGMIWSLGNHIPMVVSSDSSVRDQRRIRLKEFMKKRVVRLFSAGLAAGSLSAEYLVALGLPRERIAIGPANAIDLRHFADAADSARRADTTMRQRWGLPERYFFAASRFSPEKNISGLLRAYARYRERAGKDAWHLVLAGDGPLKSEIESQIRGLGLEQYVVLPGFVSFDALPLYYGLAEAFVHASYRDTWAIVVNEAMAAGLPVIVSNRCGCVPELVRDGENGFIIDPNATDQLADRLWQMAQVDSYRAAMGQESRRIIAEWSPERYAANLQSVVNVALRMPLPRYGILDRLLLLALAAIRR